MTDQTVSLSLTMDEALVLYEFLTRYTDSDRLETIDQAEQRALWNLCALFEQVLVQPFDPDYVPQFRERSRRLPDSTRPA